VSLHARRALRRDLIVRLLRLGHFDVRPWDIGPGGPPEASPFGADDLAIWSCMPNTLVRTGWHDDGFARDWPIDPELALGGLSFTFTPPALCAT
jgi:hypothetical protein